jgi:hypothetical protein
MAAVDWTDEQNDAIVADYFAMLAKEFTKPCFAHAKRRISSDKIDKVVGETGFPTNLAHPLSI